MHRGLIGLVAATALGLAATAPALASARSLASTGNATSITATSADLNGVVYRSTGTARWRFEYSSTPAFDAVQWSPSVPTSGHLVAVESRIFQLAPDSTYFWRAVLVLRSGTGTDEIFGTTARLVTAAAAASASPARR